MGSQLKGRYLRWVWCGHGGHGTHSSVQNPLQEDDAADCPPHLLGRHPAPCWSELLHAAGVTFSSSLESLGSALAQAWGAFCLPWFAPSAFLVPLGSADFSQRNLQTQNLKQQRAPGSTTMRVGAARVRCGRSHVSRLWSDSPLRRHGPFHHHPPCKGWPRSPRAPSQAPVVDGRAGPSGGSSLRSEQAAWGRRRF